VQWNGVSRSTVFVNEHELQVTIPAADLTVAAWYPLTVLNPSPGGGASAPFPVVVDDLLFKDGFETGDLSAWSSSSVDGGDLRPSGTAALDGTWGLEAVVNDTNSLYVQDDTPSAEHRYRTRFLFDTGTFDPGEAQGHFRTRIFVGFKEAPNRRQLAVVLKRQGGLYDVFLRVRQDDGTQASAGPFRIVAGTHSIQLDWLRATAPSADDGEATLWLDDVLKQTLTGLDTDANALDFVRLGALSVKGGAGGTLRFDKLESRRQQFIQP
jgi:hypothetical protein